MKLYFKTAALLTILAFAFPAQAATPLATRLSGRILLQVESYGRAWYVRPEDGTRYYLQDGPTAYYLMQHMGLGISNLDLKKIPQKRGDVSNKKLVARLAGRILLQVEEHGEAWYVNPADGLRYYLKDGDAAYDLMRKLSLGISNVDLATIAMNSEQIAHDTTFDDVAYIAVQNGTAMAEKYADQILPPASMSKLMSALVLLDQSPDWNKSVTITAEHLTYPKLLAGDDATSEVDLAANDIVRFSDLWIAMLVASSNQATMALVDASGLTRPGFVAAMNAKSATLGLTHTKFYDATGLDAHNVTTAREMASIATAAFNNSLITNTTQTSPYTITTLQTPSREVSVADRNYSLRAYGATAAKTGYLVEAQRCVSLKKDDTIIVVMHARSMSERNKILDLLTANQ